ncbi:MAG: ECF transporter S component [Clostridia bacterium]|nr:ECF transporter S component [Clostridia bacterium]
MANEKQRENILKLVQLAILTALVLVLQALGSFIKIGPLPMSFVLVPIVIGACLLGTKSGTFLGFVFGFITMLMGVLGADGFSLLLFEANPVWFIILCLLKATAAGFASGLVYRLLEKAFKGKKKLLQTILASITAPIVNTGIFVVGMLLFFLPTAEALRGDYANAVQFVFLGLAGFNFIGEFVVNLVLSPAIVRIIDAVKKKLHF